eukprot:gnl/MRDRNA2_/MRDRNA2_76222_c0_seq2.p1 gnl/MRDRNA2_/MRDRNA2_76222_c0~~gnl/MRDRNA2_/MRDRNA2_76222_c0_seq2.p1  ORF type:complete len:383 (+),score=36.35 gnl/MRDRNA2_/MRDRNA2_76222_c0_seq2:85-1233(+)
MIICSHRRIHTEVIIVLCCILPFLAFAGIKHAVNPSDSDLARKWAVQPWIPGFCEVEDVGIAYRGNCKTDVMNTGENANEFRFAECMGPDEEMYVNAHMQKAWQQSEAGMCAARGDQIFHIVHNDVDTKEALSDMDTAKPSDCHNLYLPWALLRFDRMTATLLEREILNRTSHSPKRCAYQFGASLPSLTADWEDITEMVEFLQSERDSYHSGGRGKVQCWALKSDDCVVTYMDQRTLVGGTKSRVTLWVVSSVLCGILVAGLVIYVFILFLRHPQASYDHCAILCAVCAACFAFCAACTNPQRRRREPPGGFHHSLPTQDPDCVTQDPKAQDTRDTLVPEIPLTDRIRRAMTASMSQFTPQMSSRQLGGNLRHNAGSDFVE